MAATAVMRKLPFGKNWPNWLQSVVSWGIILILTTMFTTFMAQSVSQAKLQALENRMDRHETTQQQQMLTVDRFNQFERDQVQRDSDQAKRMDRVENKLDRLLEKR